MPTLLSINNYFYRRDGSEALYLAHNELFGAAGWDVVPFSMQHPLNAGSEWSRHFVEEIEFGRDYTFSEKLKRVPKVVYSFEAQRKLERLLREVRPQIAHCHSIYHRLSPSILRVLRRARIPTVMTLHDLKIACPAYHMFDGQRICEKCKGGRLHNVMRNRCIKGSLPLSATVMAEAVVHRLLRSYTTCVNAFVAPSRFYIEKLTEWGWHRSHFVHVPNFVDEDKLRPSFTPGRAVVYFGRLSAEKGLLTLARAAGIAKVPVRIVGDGPLRELLQAEAARWGADMVFKGRLTGQELWSEVKSARASVLPAEGYENAPMSVLESYALGKPVIGADIGGIPELIRHGSIGWIFRSGNEEELATALRLVADLPDAAIEAAGREARATVETEYSRARYWQRMIALYATLREAA